MPFRIILVLAMLCSLPLASCKKDKCDKVECLNGGGCANGKCTCPAGTRGKHCEIVDRSNFLVPGGGNSNWSAVSSCTVDYSAVMTTGLAIHEIYLQNFYGDGSIVTININELQVTIPAQIVNNVTIAGSGNLSSDYQTLSLTYTRDNGSGPQSCTSTWTRQ